MEFRSIPHKQKIRESWILTTEHGMILSRIYGASKSESSCAFVGNQESTEHGRCYTSTGRSSHAQANEAMH